MARHILIVILVGVNLLLLAGLVIVACPPPSAVAGVTINEAGYLLIPCQTGINNNVIFVLDTNGQLLHVFGVGQEGRLKYQDTRDLNADFSKKEAVR